jgi:glutaminyl-tRNA synthetase
MPTIRGLRRRGYTPAIMNSFCDEIGVARADGTIEFEKLQNVARQSFDSSARRVMACLDPIKVSIAGVEEWGELQVLDFPQDSESKKRPLAMGPEIYIDRSDFREVRTAYCFGQCHGHVHSPPNMTLARPPIIAGGPS